MVFKCANTFAYKYKVLTMWKIFGDNYSEFIFFFWQMVHNARLSKIFKRLELKGYKYSSVLKPLFLYKSSQSSDPSTLIQWITKTYNFSST